jgi:hypothetical protein
MKPTIIERARAYLARMPISVQGQGGHTAAFNAALALTKGFDLGEQDAFMLLSEWNAQCLPPWNDSDLRHKLKSAAASDKPNGYLLADDLQRHQTTPDHETEAERKARNRQSWPEFKRLKPAGVEMIAKLRGIDIDAVDLANRCGLLKGAMIDGHPSFIITEGTFAQARKLSGEPFEKKDGSKIKAKNLPGSEGAFIGRSWLYDARHVLLTEGCIGLLEGMAALLPSYVATEQPWGVLAATSASSRFARAPDLLASLAGRHVRIIPDNDDAGRQAAMSWMTDLEAAGATVDVKQLPTGFKDLGEMVNSPEAHQTLAALFQ